MTHEIPGSMRTAIGITGSQGPISPEPFQHLPGIRECVPISKPYKLVSREVKPDSTMIDVRGARIGGGSLAMMAGPCSAESRDQTLQTTETVARSGAKFFHGAFKPRTSPYAFRGLKEEGPRILEQAKRQFDLHIVTEVMGTETLPAVAECVDILQIGACNMQNSSFLEALGRLRKPRSSSSAV